MASLRLFVVGRRDHILHSTAYPLDSLTSDQEVIFMEITIVLLFATSLALSFLCQVYVSLALYRNDCVSDVVLGGLNGRQTYILGWAYAEQLNLSTVMTAWSLIIAAFLISACVFATFFTM